MLYKINTPRQIRTGHTALVAPPLALIMVFCFVMVLVQPSANKLPTQPAASSQSAPPSVLSQTALPPLTFGPVSPLSIITPPPTPVPVTTPGITTPQPVAISSNKLQDATLNTRQLSTTKPTTISQPKTIISPAKPKPTTTSITVTPKAR